MRQANLNPTLRYNRHKLSPKINKQVRVTLARSGIRMHKFWSFKGIILVDYKFTVFDCIPWYELVIRHGVIRLRAKFHDADQREVPEHDLIPFRMPKCDINENTKRSYLTFDCVALERWFFWKLRGLTLLTNRPQCNFVQILFCF